MEMLNATNKRLSSQSTLFIYEQKEKKKDFVHERSIASGRHRSGRTIPFGILRQMIVLHDQCQWMNAVVATGSRSRKDERPMGKTRIRANGHWSQMMDSTLVCVTLEIEEKRCQMRTRCFLTWILAVPLIRAWDPIVTCVQSSTALYSLMITP